jgi:hypothetical protein
MRGTRLRLRHLVGAAILGGSLLFGALSFTSLPAGAQTAPDPPAPASCPVLSLANPNPGDIVPNGHYVVSGLAWDPAATSGSGIARVDLFLGRRDQGGTFLASATPGSGDVSDPRAFSVTVNLPDVDSGRDFAAYAISSVSGQEVTVVRTIFVGTQSFNPLATATPVPTIETVSSTCPRVPAAAAPSTSGAAAGVSAPAVSTSSMAAAPATGGGTATNGCPVLSLGNPHPGSLLPPGDMFISGSASVPGASPQPGVSRVDLFLGARDAGGQFLGSGMPGTGQTSDPAAFTVRVTIPTTLNRGVDFAAYAIGTNGQQTSDTFQVFVGAPATRGPVAPSPTPIPTAETVSSTC